ncbi:MAG: hypothetical protein OEW00_15150 [candidate division Zixibacteria bacterium]|nr:hypothetical protein [candidate division Zixibacteria bacterium]
MRNSHNLVRILLVLFLVVGICRANEEADSPGTDAQKAQLAIAGKSILTLVLENEQAQPIALVASMEDYEVIISRPAEAGAPKPVEFVKLPADGGTVSLTPGRYRWNSVVLRDESKKLKFSARNQRGDWFDLSPGSTSTLEIGGPLRQSLKVSRSGALLNFEYKLLGAAGEEYSPVRPESVRQQTERPELSIYKANRRISGGSFRYG